MTSLELSKQLKKLKCQQDSLWHWVYLENEFCQDWILVQEDGSLTAVYENKNYSAFTVAELGEILPRTIQWHDLEHTLSYSIDDYRHKGFLHRVHYKHGTNGISSGGLKTEADARAKMLIYLIENKLMEANK